MDDVMADYDRVAVEVAVEQVRRSNYSSG